MNLHADNWRDAWPYEEEQIEKTRSPATKAIRRLVKDLHEKNPELWRNVTETVYWGNGDKTPILSPSALRIVLERNLVRPEETSPFAEGAGEQEISESEDEESVLENLILLDSLRRERGLDLLFLDRGGNHVLAMRFYDPFSSVPEEAVVAERRTFGEVFPGPEEVLVALSSLKETPEDDVLLTRRPGGDGLYGLDAESLEALYLGVPAEVPFFTIGRRFRFLGAEPADPKNVEEVAVCFSIGYPALRLMERELDAFVREKHGNLRGLDLGSRLTFLDREGERRDLREIVDDKGRVAWGHDGVLFYETFQDPLKGAYEGGMRRVRVLGCDFYGSEVDVVYEGFSVPEVWHLWLGIDAVLRERPHRGLRNVLRDRPFYGFYKEDSVNAQRANGLTELETRLGRFVDASPFRREDFRLCYRTVFFIDAVEAHRTATGEAERSLGHLAFVGDSSELDLVQVRREAQERLKATPGDKDPEILLSSRAVGSTKETLLLTSRDARERLVYGLETLVVRRRERKASNKVDAGEETGQGPVAAFESDDSVFVIPTSSRG